MKRLTSACEQSVVCAQNNVKTGKNHDLYHNGYIPSAACLWPVMMGILAGC
jgi:hypothetical protein